jgi:hypothetical protein
VAPHGSDGWRVLGRDTSDPWDPQVSDQREPREGTGEADSGPRLSDARGGRSMGRAGNTAKWAEYEVGAQLG